MLFPAVKQPPYLMLNITMFASSPVLFSDINGKNTVQFQQCCSVVCLKGQMPVSEMQLHVCQQCKFVINGENSPVMTTALQNPENAKCNYKRQDLESIQGKWNGDLPRDIAKDQDLSKNTAYTVRQINIDLGTLPSLMP